MSRRDDILVSRTLYHIGVVTLFAVTVWLVIGVYFAATGEQKVVVDPKILEPLNPTIDQATVNEMTTRVRVERSVAPPPPPTVNIVETPQIASESASIEEETPEIIEDVEP